MSVKSKLIRNTIVNYAIRFWGFALTFVLFWYIVGNIGETEYGIYLFITAITGYFGILDLGIGNSLVKFVAQYHAEDDKEKLNEVINTSFFIFLFIGIASALIIFLIGTFLLEFLSGTFPALDAPDFYPKARAIIYILGAIFMFSLSLASLKGILAGLQRYDILAMITFIMSIVNVVVVVLVLSMGMGVVELVFYTSCVGLIGFILTAWFVQKLLPHVTIKFSYVKRDMIKVLMDLSMSVFLLSVFIMVIYYTDRLVIGLLVDVTLLTFYQAAWKLYGIPTRIPEIGLYAVIPAASELEATDNLPALRRLFLRGTKYVLALSLALGVPLFFLSEGMLTIWMGDEYGQYYIIVQILMISIFFDFNNYVATQILIGMNRIKKFVRYYGIVALLNLCLSVFLVQQGYGLTGVALGTTIPFVLLEVLFLAHVFKVLDIKWGDYAKQVFAKTFPFAGIVSLAMYGAILLRPPYIIGTHTTLFGLIKDSVEIVLYFGFGCCLYLLLFYFKGLDTKEKGEIKHIFNRIKARLKFWGKNNGNSQMDSEDKK
ncbi:MAG: flippase [Thermoplasmata archaeon]|nr:MAG: flippase [Thermoplasmata archaeon]